MNTVERLRWNFRFLCIKFHERSSVLWYIFTLSPALHIIIHGSDHSLSGFNLGLQISTKLHRTPCTENRIFEHN